MSLTITGDECHDGRMDAFLSSDLHLVRCRRERERHDDPHAAARRASPSSEIEPRVRSRALRAHARLQPDRTIGHVAVEARCESIRIRRAGEFSIAAMALRAFTLAFASLRRAQHDAALSPK